MARFFAASTKKAMMQGAFASRQYSSGFKYSFGIIWYVIGALIVFRAFPDILKAWKVAFFGEAATTDDLYFEELQANSQASISSGQAKQIADNIYTAFTVPFGTDEAALNTLTADLTSEDLKLVWAMFGKRREFFWQPEKDLGAWLRSELSGALLDQYVVMFNNAGFIF